MANLQIKGVDDAFYENLKRLAASENRSVSRQVLQMLREYMAKSASISKTKTPAEALLALAGSWEDERSAEEICSDLKALRKSSNK